MPATSVLISPHPHVLRQPGSHQDLGPYLNVVTWILLITSLLAVLTRLITKRALKRRIDVDDAFVLAALVMSIGSGIVVSIQTSNGLGRDVSLLNTDQLQAYQKGEYANKLLYIATLVFAKLSIITLLRMLTASSLHRQLGIMLTVFIMLWGIASEIVLAFQCGSQAPWNFMEPESRCVNLPSFWRAMGVINILTDLALIMFPVHVIVTLRLSAGKKVAILVFFSARSLDIVASAVQMAYLYGFSSPNPTVDLFKWVLLTQVIECVTILTSCVPYLRPLLESLPSGLYGSDELRRRGTPSELGYAKSKTGSYQLSSGTSKTRTETRHSRKSENEVGIRRFLPMLSQEKTTNSSSASGLPGGPSRPDGRTDVEITAVHHKLGEDKSWETESTSSHSKILKTTVVSAEWEEARMTGNCKSYDEISAAK